MLFILGTFLVAGYLEQSLFFEHLASQIVRHVGPRPGMLLGTLMVSAMIASAIVGEVAAILFVGGAMLHIAQRYQIRPIPFLIMLVFATNTGSAAAAFGPVGITIALKAHLTVMDFFRWATPIALAVLAVVYGICRWWFAADWQALAKAVRNEPVGLPDAGSGRSAMAGWILVLSMTALLIFHAQIEAALGLRANVMLLAAALGAGVVGLLLAGRGAGEVIARRVDWGTLLFFLMLFIVVGALEATGVTGVMARALLRGTGGRPAALVLAVGWSTGFLSALLANLLAVAAFVPVVADLNAHGAACPTAVYWLMLFVAHLHGEHDQHRINVQYHRLRDGGPTRTWNDLFRAMAENRSDRQPGIDGAGDVSAGDPDTLAVAGMIGARDIFQRGPVNPNRSYHCFSCSRDIGNGLRPIGMTLSASCTPWRSARSHSVRNIAAPLPLPGSGVQMRWMVSWRSESIMNCTNP